MAGSYEGTDAALSAGTDDPGLQYLYALPPRGAAQLSNSYGFYACHLLRTNGVLFAILSDSLAGRMPTCKRQRVPGTLVPAQHDVPDAGHPAGGADGDPDGLASNPGYRKYSELRPAKRVRRAVDKLLLRRAYDKARQENPALERLFAQEREQAVVQMNLNAKNYALAAEPMSNVYGALYSTLATDDPNQRKSMRYIGSCIGRIFYLLDKAERFEADSRNGRYNVFVVNELNGQACRHGKRPAAGAGSGQRPDAGVQDAGCQAERHPAEQYHDPGPAARGRPAGAGRRYRKMGDPMKKRKSKSWAMAYCGMAAALCVALMLLGTIIPIAMFIAPAVASFLIATVCWSAAAPWRGRPTQPSACWGCSLCRIRRWP